MGQLRRMRAPFSLSLLTEIGAIVANGIPETPEEKIYSAYTGQGALRSRNAKHQQMGNPFADGSLPVPKMPYGLGAPANGLPMTLDLPTLMVMQSFAIASAGAILVFAWTQNRAEPSLALWGFGHLLVAAGLVGLMFGAIWHQPLWTGVGGGLMCLQPSMIWKATRAIDGKSGPLWLVLIGPLLIVAAATVAILQSVIAPFGMSVFTSYVIAAAAQLWLGRRDRLFARWALIALLAIHALALLIGVISTVIGSTGPDVVPPIMSLFGFIYFEAIVFAIGSAVSLYALIKERNEAVTSTLARTDGLTGIANRAHFLDTAERALQRCRRDGAPVSVVMFDLDGFKAVNDRFGHAAGDAMLRKFAEVTAAALRPHDLFGRIGGEEFAVVMPGCGIEAAYARAERIRVAFAEDCRFGAGHQVKTTVSGGVSVSETATETLDALLELADAALYQAKGDGRNRVRRAKQDAPVGGASNVFRVA